ncbi:ankyrin repeat domain-containing protein, partial [Myxococcota bacterium]|nr:ankyrin repeat domain-containing protein [Myxococcota bacterium]
AFAAKGYLVAMKLLKDNPAAYGARNIEDQSAYHLAAEKNQSAFMATFFAYAKGDDVNINSADAYRRPPLFYAARSGSLAAARWLMSKKADTTQVDEKGNTLMHYAALSDRVYMVDYFKKLKVPHNIKNKDGKLPMDLAKSKRVKQLLK